MSAIPKNDDFYNLMKDLLMKDHFVKGSIAVSLITLRE